MPDVAQLIELLEAVCGDPLQSKELAAMLKKISKTTCRVHIDVDYNGREFFWKIPLHNPTASEITSLGLYQRKNES
jgi:hypothetical protein